MAINIATKAVTIPAIKSEAAKGTEMTDKGHSIGSIMNDCNFSSGERVKIALA
jgi:hypothetical protein